MDVSIETKQKYDALLMCIKELDSVAIGYSGGVDSTFLLAAAVEAIGDKAIGVIGRSATYPKREMEEAVSLAKEIGARITFVDTDELNDPAFNTNPPTRCFACKTTLFKEVWDAAEKHGCKYVLEGSNADDTGDFRPGMDAARKLQVKAPLLEVGLTKDEIRSLSKLMGLATWNKPAFACLSSRIPYGQLITAPRLSRIEQAEYALRDMGFAGVRVRDYEEMCRIEVAPAEIPRFLTSDVREPVVSALKKAGYKFVCLDLEGYRTGSMNEVLSQEVKDQARG